MIRAHAAFESSKRHPYVHECNQAYKALKKHLPEWKTSKIVRRPLNGVARYVEVFINGKSVFKSSKPI